VGPARGYAGLVSSLLTGPDILRLGIMDYREAWDVQRRLHDEVVDGTRGDTVLLLEHPSVYTAGKRTEPMDRPTDGTPVVDVDRGGKITWHGPGQLVGYPILDLNPNRRDVRRYVNNLEEVMIRVAAHYGLRAGRIQGLNGTWVGDRKLGAVGVRIQRWITLHGFALNVSTELSAFDLIVPCGIKDKRVTSLQQELGKDPGLDDVMTVATQAFAEVFAAEPELREALPALD